MPGGAQWSHLLFVAFLGILLLLEEWLRRRSSPAPQDVTARTTQRLHRQQRGIILLAPVVALGAMWLIPWAAALAGHGPATLLPGLLLLLPFLASLRHALSDTESDD
jgi:hypothetical protein